MTTPVNRHARRAAAREIARRAKKVRLALYQSRSCGTCRACCTTMRVDSIESDAVELHKAPGEPCPHLSTDPATGGCTIYESRPEACREWACVWRTGSDVLETKERPDQVGIVFDTVVKDGFPLQFLRGDVVENNEWWPVTAQRLGDRGYLVVVPTGRGDEVMMFGPESKRRMFKEWVEKERAG